MDSTHCPVRTEFQAIKDSSLRPHQRYRERKGRQQNAGNNNRRGHIREHQSGNQREGMRDANACRRAYPTLQWNANCWQTQIRARISVPLVPPNPNEFDSAARIGIWRASRGM